MIYFGQYQWLFAKTNDYLTACRKGILKLESEGPDFYIVDLQLSPVNSMMVFYTPIDGDGNNFSIDTYIY